MTNKQFTDVLVSSASGIFLGVVLFEILPEGVREIGAISTVVWFVAGILGWYILKRITHYFSEYSLAIVSALAFWSHSFLEGAVTALSFSISETVGVAVAAGMLLHLIPEFYAVVGLLKGEGISIKKSVWVDLGGIAVLFLSFGIIYLFLQGIQSDTLVPYEILSGGAFAYIGAASFLKRGRNVYTITGLLLGLGVIGLWRFLLK